MPLAAPARVILPGDYLELVIVGYERELYAKARRVRPGRRATKEDFPPSVPLSPALAPRVLRLAKEAAAVLRVSTPYEIHVTRDLSDHLNAQAMLSQDPFRIRLIGSVARLLDDDALLGLLGHEFGHLLVSGPGAPLGCLPGEELEYPSRQDQVSALVAAELTADRLGLLACQDIAAVVRLELASWLGDSPSAMETDEGTFLEECGEALLDEPPESWIRRTHPSPRLRIHATHLFWRSDVFRRLTGRGPADWSLDAVDRQVQDMIRLAVRHLPEEESEASWSPDALVERVRPALLDASATLEQLGERASALLTGWRERKTPSAPVAPAADTEIDALEARFQRLEREAILASSGSVSAEMEARFRALEEAEET